MKSPPKEKPGAGELTGQISKRLREAYRFPDSLQATFRRLEPISSEGAAPSEKKRGHAAGGMGTDNTNESEREQRELRSIELQQILQPNSSHIATETAGEKAALLRCCKNKTAASTKTKKQTGELS
jgi:hypothetical protein